MIYDSIGYSFPYCMDENDVKQLPRFQHQMENTIMTMRAFRNQLYNYHLLHKEISHRLQYEEQMQMVIYSLGSLKDNYAFHHQLALALLLREKGRYIKNWRNTSI